MELTLSQREWMEKHLSQDKAELITKVISVCRDEAELQTIIEMGQFLSENRQVLDRIAIDPEEI